MGWKKRIYIYILVTATFCHGAVSLFFSYSLSLCGLFSFPSSSENADTESLSAPNTRIQPFLSASRATERRQNFLCALARLFSISARDDDGPAKRRGLCCLPSPSSFEGKLAKTPVGVSRIIRTCRLLRLCRSRKARRATPSRLEYDPETAATVSLLHLILERIHEPREIYQRVFWHAVSVICILRHKWFAARVFVYRNKCVYEEITIDYVIYTTNNITKKKKMFLTRVAIIVIPWPEKHLPNLLEEF